MLPETNDAATAWRLLRVLPESVALGCSASGTAAGKPASAATDLGGVGCMSADKLVALKLLQVSSPIVDATRTVHLRESDGFGCGGINAVLKIVHKLTRAEPTLNMESLPFCRNAIRV